MGIQFNIDEIFTMAEQIERNGSNFYKKAAGNFKGSDSYQMLLELSEWEQRHLNTFAAMRNEVTDDQKKKMAFDPNGEAELYLRAIADGYVFELKKEPAESLTGHESIEDILNIAIGLEKDSILFYLGMQDVVPEKLGKARISDIIREERRHVRMLAERKAAVT